MFQKKMKQMLQTMMEISKAIMTLMPKQLEAIILHSRRELPKRRSDEKKKPVNVEKQNQEFQHKNSASHKEEKMTKPPRKKE